jgi:hypothetical protein
MDKSDLIFVGVIVVVIFLGTCSMLVIKHGHDLRELRCEQLGGTLINWKCLAVKELK